jgi:hypothetical protein
MTSNSWIIVIAGGLIMMGFFYWFFIRKKPENETQNNDFKERQKAELKLLAENYKRELKTSPKSARKELHDKYITARIALIEANETDSKSTLKPPDKKTATLPEECRIYDNITGTKYNITLTGESIDRIRAENGTLGRKWLKDGKWLFALNKKLNDSGEIEFTPVILPITLDNPPSRLRRALSHPYVPFTWNMKQPTNILAKFGGVIIFGIIAIGAVFLVAAK